MKWLFIENRLQAASFWQSKGEIVFEDFVAGDTQTTSAVTDVIRLDGKLQKWFLLFVFADDKKSSRIIRTIQ